MTQNHRPHIAMRYNPSIAWKASPTRTPPPICTSAPFPKPRWSEEAVGAANAVRDTSCPISRNGNDSTRVPGKSTSRSPNQAAVFVQSSKVLNLCGDSRCRSAVTFLTIARNKFINCLCLSGAEIHFRTTDRRYADKWLRKRDFFCSSEEGNPAGLFNAVAKLRLLFQKPARS